MTASPNGESAALLPEMQTVFGQALVRHATSEHVAAAIALPEREIGFPELLRAVESCAAWLVRRGCAASEVVAITIADEYAHMVASAALLVLGIPQICLPTRDPESMRLRVAQRIGVSRAIVTDAKHAVAGVQTVLLRPEILRGAGEAAPSRPARHG